MPFATMSPGWPLSTAYPSCSARRQAFAARRNCSNRFQCRRIASRPIWVKARLVCGILPRNDFVIVISSPRSSLSSRTTGCLWSTRVSDCRKLTIHLTARRQRRGQDREPPDRAHESTCEYVVNRVVHVTNRVVQVTNQFVHVMNRVGQVTNQSVHAMNRRVQRTSRTDHPITVMYTQEKRRSTARTDALTVRLRPLAR